MKRIDAEAYVKNLLECVNENFDNLFSDVFHKIITITENEETDYSNIVPTILENMKKLIYDIQQTENFCLYAIDSVNRKSLAITLFILAMVYMENECFNG